MNKVYTVVAGRYLTDDTGQKWEHRTVTFTELTEDEAKTMYYNSRGYEFSRIEIDGKPGVDVSDELHGIKE